MKFYYAYLIKGRYEHRLVLTLCRRYEEVELRVYTSILTRALCVLGLSAYQMLIFGRYEHVRYHLYHINL